MGRCGRYRPVVRREKKSVTGFSGKIPAVKEKRTMEKIFRQAQWITSADFRDAPVNMLFHRQLEKTD